MNNINVCPKHKGTKTSSVSNVCSKCGRLGIPSTLIERMGWFKDLAAAEKERRKKIVMNNKVK